jgi:hypothetical protein
LIDCPLWAAVTEATEGRGRAVEEALFDNVTVRTPSREGARATPLFRSRPTCFEAFNRKNLSGQKSRFLSFVGAAECIHRSESVLTGATRLRSPPTTNPGGPPRSPLRAPQTTDTKRDARYYEHSGISDLSCVSFRTSLEASICSVRRDIASGRDYQKYFS